MKNAQLIELYKIEKSHLDFPSNPFPPFKEWKAEYLKENEGLFVTKNIDDAIKESDAIVDEEIKKLIEQEKAPKIVKIKVPKVEKKSTKTSIKKENGGIKKTDQAKLIYQEMMNKENGSHPKRSDVIKRFMDECGLSQAGASTYQYNMKKMFSQQ